MKQVSLKDNPLILWKDLLDLGIESSFIFFKKKKNEREALRQLKVSLFRQSQEHLQALYKLLKKIK